MRKYPWGDRWTAKIRPERAKICNTVTEFFFYNLRGRFSQSKPWTNPNKYVSSNLWPFYGLHVLWHHSFVFLSKEGIKTNEVSLHQEILHTMNLIRNCGYIFIWNFSCFCLWNPSKTYRSIFVSHIQHTNIHTHTHTCVCVCDVDAEYIRILESLYTQSIAKVKTKRVGQSFQLCRGVRRPDVS